MEGGRERRTYLVVEREAVVGVLDELVDGEGGVVGLHHRVGHLVVERRREGGREGGMVRVVSS